MSAPEKSCGPGTIFAPAASKSLSGTLAAIPAPDCTRIAWRPPAASFLTVSGVAATRVSPARVSAGMPMFMDFSLAAETKPDDTRPRIIGSTQQGEVMTIKVRRVVTGHDGKGRAVVKIDEVSKNIVSNRPGASACVVWTTDTIPADNSGDSDASAKKVGTTLPGGTVFRVIEFSPGVAPRAPHRLDRLRGGDLGRDRYGAGERHGGPRQGGRRAGAA